MYNYKKLTLLIITLLFIILSLIELMYYFKVDSTLFGMIYLLITLFIVFLLVPTAYNYRKAFSPSRASKLIIVIIVGVFCSYILGPIVIKNTSYLDDSKTYIKNIFLYKNIFKGILYFILTIFVLLEFKIDRLIMKSISKKKVD